MCSGPTQVEDGLTAKARIRNAAIDCFARHGSDCTVRMVAGAAGVSPGLVIHHFRSMEGLRAACDRHVIDAVRAMKSKAMAAGPAGLDLAAALRDEGVGQGARYLARMLAEETPAAAQLVDGLIADAERYMEEGVRTGILRPTECPRERAIVMGLWSMSVLVMHHHLTRLLGVDFTDPAVGADPVIANYLRPAYDILGDGLFTEAAAESLRAAAEEIAAGAYGPGTPEEAATTRGTR